MITLYCLRRLGDPPPPDGLVGIGGAAVRVVREGMMAAWVSEGSSPAADVTSVRAHDAVVRSALRSATPVPARFGTVFTDEAELSASLRERGEELWAALERVQGRVEMGVVVEWEDLPESPPGGPIRSGRAYLERRRQAIEADRSRRERAEGLLGRVEAQLARDGVAAVRTLLPARGVAGTVAHLVHRQEARSYRTRVEAARDLHAGVGLYLTGPWAPYSFV